MSEDWQDTISVKRKDLVRSPSSKICTDFPQILRYRMRRTAFRVTPSVQSRNNWSENVRECTAVDSRKNV